MKTALTLVLCLPLVATAALPQTAFDGPDASIRVLDTPSNHPLRRGNVITFSAETTLKVSSGVMPAGTEAALIWSIDCSAQTHRILLAAIKAPGQQPVVISREQLIETAKETPFISFDDPVSVAVSKSLCANVK